MPTNEPPDPTSPFGLFSRAFLRLRSGVCGIGVRGGLHEGMVWRSPSGTSCHGDVGCLSPCTHQPGPHAGQAWALRPTRLAGGSSRSVAPEARWP